MATPGVEGSRSSDLGNNGVSWRESRVGPGLADVGRTCL